MEISYNFKGDYTENPEVFGSTLRITKKGDPERHHFIDLPDREWVIDRVYQSSVLLKLPDPPIKRKEELYGQAFPVIYTDDHESGYVEFTETLVIEYLYQSDNELTADDGTNLIAYVTDPKQELDHREVLMLSVDYFEFHEE